MDSFPCDSGFLPCSGLPAPDPDRIRGSSGLDRCTACAPTQEDLSVEQGELVLISVLGIAIEQEVESLGFGGCAPLSKDPVHDTVQRTVGIASSS